MNRHLEWIEAKVRELDKVDEPIEILLDVDKRVKDMSVGETADIIMYLLGEIHRARNGE